MPPRRGMQTSAQLLSLLHRHTYTGHTRHRLTHQQKRAGFVYLVSHKSLQDAAFAQRLISLKTGHSLQFKVFQSVPILATYAVIH